VELGNLSELQKEVESVNLVVSIMLSWSADAFLHRCEISCEESMDKSTSVAKPTSFVNPTSKVAVSVLLCSVSCALSRKQNKWNRN